MEEVKNDVYQSSCVSGGEEFGTEALFEQTLVPQKQDFLEDARGRDENSWDWCLCTEKIEKNEPTGKKLLILAVLKGREFMQIKFVYRTGKYNQMKPLHIPNQ